MGGILQQQVHEHELQVLWFEYFSSKSDDLRNRLVERYMYLANRIAAYYYSKRIGGQTDYDDYQSLAVIGLIQAIEKYDISSNAKFETYASYRIKGSILNSIRQFSEKTAYLAYDKLRNLELIDSVTETNSEDQGQDIFERILEVTLNLSYSALLEGAVRYDIHEHNSLSPLDGYHHCELDELRRIISEIVEVLPKKQKVIVRYYYYYELSFVEISALIGISKGRVSQIHRQAIETVREVYNKIVNVSQVY